MPEKEERSWYKIWEPGTGFVQKLITKKEEDELNHRSGHPAYIVEESYQANKGTPGDGDKVKEGIRRWLGGRDEQ